MSGFARFSAVVIMIDCVIGGIAAFLAFCIFLSRDILIAVLLLLLATLAFSLMSLAYSLAYSVPDELESLSKRVKILQREVDGLKKELRREDVVEETKESKIALESKEIKKTRKVSKLVEDAWRCPNCGSINLATQLNCFGCGKLCPTKNHKMGVDPENGEGATSK